MNKLSLLPTELFTIILDFTHPKDYESLKYLNKQFRRYFSENNLLIAKQIFHSIIQTPDKTIIQFKLQEIPKFFIPSDQELDQLENSADLLRNCNHVEKKFYECLQELTSDKSKAKQLVLKFKSIITDPNPPEPMLKKDIHIYGTPSEHQTYLTEVYNGIVFKPRKHKERDIMKEITENLKGEFSQQDNSLIQLRWYEYESLKVDKTSQYFKVLSIYQCLVYLIKQYCSVFRGYLDCLKDNKRFLKEYSRVWTEFAYGMREFDAIMSSYNQLINSIYSKVFFEHYQKPEFSIWRLMIKIWYKEVYCPLEPKIFEKFTDILFPLIAKEFLKASLHQSQQEELNRNYLEFLNIPDLPNYIEPKKIQKCLKRTMISVDDLSLNEYTVFYNDCQYPEAVTPKGIFLEKLLQKSRAFNLILLKNLESTELRSVLNKLEDYLKSLFNRPTAMKLFSNALSNLSEEESSSEKAQSIKSLCQQMGKRINYQEEEFEESAEYIESRGHYKIKANYERYFDCFTPTPREIISN